MSPADSQRARRGRRRMSSAERREQLIMIARGLFAERGFDGTSVEEIAAHAEVSRPVVYEHFGGKEGLYKAVWDYAVDHAIEKSADVDLSTDQDREWLYHYLRVCVLSVFDTGISSLLRRLIANEINDPSPISGEVLSEHLAPRIQELEKRLRRMMGPYVTDFQVGCCILAIHSQFSAITINRSARRNLFKNDKPSPEEAERFTREICAFVMGGIRAIRGVPPAARRLRTPAKEPTPNAPAP